MQSIIIVVYGLITFSALDTILCTGTDKKVIQEQYVDTFLQMIQRLPKVNSLNFTGKLLPTTYNGTVTFSCRRLFTARASTPVTWPPPKMLPLSMKDKFSMDGAATVTQEYHTDQQNGGEGYIWDKKLITDLGAKPDFCGNYNSDECGIVLKKFGTNFIKGKSGIVVGSQTPWAEAALLAAGAAHVTTIEYMNITTNHKQLSTMTPEQAASTFLSGKFPRADFIFSYSSIEHNGLGRYGDPINPTGDLEAVAQMHCMLKKNGVLFLGIPVGGGKWGGEFGEDVLVWNAHRVYGKTRLTALLSFWKFIHVERSNNAAHPIFVLQKTSPLQRQDKAINIKPVHTTGPH